MAGQDDEEAMAKFVAEFGLDGFEHIADPSGQVWSTFGITAQPSYVFINDDGEIARQVGALPDDEFLAVLERLTLN